MIKKNKIPLLEFDTERLAVINPSHMRPGEAGLPERGIICFQGETLKRLLRARRLKKIYTCNTVCHSLKVFFQEKKGSRPQLCGSFRLKFLYDIPPFKASSLPGSLSLAADEAAPVTHQVQGSGDTTAVPLPSCEGPENLWFPATST